MLRLVKKTSHKKYPMWMKALMLLLHRLSGAIKFAEGVNFEEDYNNYDDKNLLDDNESQHNIPLHTSIPSKPTPPIPIKLTSAKKIRMLVSQGMKLWVIFMIIFIFG